MTKKKKEVVFNQKLPADESRDLYTQETPQNGYIFRAHAVYVDLIVVLMCAPKTKVDFSLYFCVMSMVVCLHACLCTMCVQRPEESI